MALTEEQLDTIQEIMLEGSEFIRQHGKFDYFNRADLCEAIDSVIDHLETQVIEAAMGLHNDEWDATLPHKAMHWGIILGAGMVLKRIEPIGEE